jgi:hypothetical protein
LSNRRVKTPEQAVHLLLEDLQRAIACVTPMQLAVNRLKGAKVTSPIAITLLGRSSRAQLGRNLWIQVAMRAEPGKDADDLKSWRTHTRFYSFALFESESGRTEILAYHYDPTSGVEWPHLHVNASSEWFPVVFEGDTSRRDA